MVGNILLGAVEKRRYGFLAGPDSFVHRVDHRFHLDQPVFGLVDYYVVSLFHCGIRSYEDKVNKKILNLNKGI